MAARPRRKAVACRFLGRDRRGGLISSTRVGVLFQPVGAAPLEAPCALEHFFQGHDGDALRGLRAFASDDAVPSAGVTGLLRSNRTSER